MRSSHACDVTMGDIIAMGTYHDITMGYDVAMGIYHVIVMEIHHDITMS